MNNNSDIQKQLAHFINFHHFSYPDEPNTIESIIASKDIRDDLSRVMQLLNMEYLFMNYQKDQDPFDFMVKISETMRDGEIVFLFLNEPILHPVVYDQFMSLRDCNRFNTFVSDKLGKISLKPPAGDAHIFLVFTMEKEKKPDERIYDLTDHLLDLREEGSS